MKKTIILGMIALMAIYTSCKSTNAKTTTKNKTEESMNNDYDDTPAYIELNDSERKLVSSNNDFAFNLMRGIQNDNSQIISPLSITYALGMLNNGAVGNTQKEINTTLGFNNADEVNAFCQKMLVNAPTLDKKTKVLIGNTVFVNKAYKLNKDFVSIANKYYDAEPENRNFADGKTLDVINKWASDHTENMIDKVLDESEFNPNAVSYLLNAIYFKGIWSEKFDKKNTQDELFNDKTKVKMMQQSKSFRYYDDEMLQAVNLPYGNGAYQLTVLLPQKGKNNVKELLSKLDNKEWNRIQSSMRKCNVKLKLPRFETKTDINLKKIMSELGMPTAFTPSAEFEKFCNSRTYIEMMKQVAKIKLDEEGTEAAAVTVIGLAKTSAVSEPPRNVEFIADHNFLYVISERSTGAIFFIGQFTGK